MKIPVGLSGTLVVDAVDLPTPQHNLAPGITENVRKMLEYDYVMVIGARRPSSPEATRIAKERDSDDLAVETIVTEDGTINLLSKLAILKRAYDDTVEMIQRKLRGEVQ